MDRFGVCRFINPQYFSTYLANLPLGLLIKNSLLTLGGVGAYNIT